MCVSELKNTKSSDKEFLFAPLFHASLEPLLLWITGISGNPDGNQAWCHTPVISAAQKAEEGASNVLRHPGLQSEFKVNRD